MTHCKVESMRLDRRQVVVAEHYFFRLADFLAANKTWHDTDVAMSRPWQHPQSPAWQLGLLCWGTALGELCGSMRKTLKSIAAPSGDFNFNENRAEALRNADENGVILQKMSRKTDHTYISVTKTMWASLFSYRTHIYMVITAKQVCALSRFPCNLI